MSHTSREYVNNEHKKGVMAAVAGYMAIKRHRGRIGKARPVKRSTAHPGAFWDKPLTPDNSDMGFRG